jgi:CubicO group peptidase (beta-lactamase class C family)
MLRLMATRHRLAAGAALAAALVGLCPAQESIVDRVVERARNSFQVPGIAVAIVKDGKVVLAKGYGQRKLGEAAPVTPETLFAIASNTKAFTTAALAMLVDEGKIRWDDPVTKHMPSFQMYDPYVTREMTIRDLLVHRSGLGLGAGDLMFFPSTDLSRAEIIHRLRFIRPATSFRSAYAYDNLLYLVAGQLIPAITGQSWDDFVRQRIFQPLGMTHTYANSEGLFSGGDVAAPHSRAGGKLEPLAFSSHDNNAPAGSINSCVADMAKWLIVRLNHGDMGGGKRLFSAAQAREMWSAVTILPVDPAPADSPALAAVRPNFAAYGLGWRLTDYRGHKLVGHTGSLAGYVSRVALVPDMKLGIVVLTNQEAEGAHLAIAQTVLDHYMGVEPPDWVSILAAEQRNTEAEAAAAVKRATAGRNANSRPSLALASYAGRYRDAWYGDVVVEERGGKLAIRFTHSPKLTGELEHWQYDTFVARWTDRTLLADAYLTFSLKPDGSIDEVKMQAVSPLTDFSFDFQDLLLKPVAAKAPAY